MLNIIFQIGRYVKLLFGLFKSPEKLSIYWTLFLQESASIGVGSLVIVIIVSLFIGAVMTITTAYQVTSAFIPNSIIGNAVSASAFLELAPTITSIVLAGIVGSSIASQIGTMRVTEQVDALEVMGINSASYLILPKILAALFTFPLLIIIAAFLQITGGMIAGELTGEVTRIEFIQGMREWFDPFQVKFMLLKAIVYGFIISSVSSYHGYFTQGGALEVGQSSTKAVIYSCIVLLAADYVITAALL